MASRISFSVVGLKAAALGRRRVEDRKREQAEIDADGGQQRDQVAAGDGLAFLGVADGRATGEDVAHEARRIGADVLPEVLDGVGDAGGAFVEDGSRAISARPAARPDRRPG